MKTSWMLRWLITCLLVTANIPCHATDVLVGRNDPAGTGANLRETALTTANVNTATFGKLFAYELEGATYAQPLIVSNLPIRGHSRNVVFVATTSGIVYALDADDPGVEGGLLWQSRLTRGGEFPQPGEGHRGVVQGNAGILGTPVVDRGRRALYVVARTQSAGVSKQFLHVLDLVTGVDRVAPQEIRPTLNVRGRAFTFDPAIQNARAGLTIARSKILVAWSSMEDAGLYHGWVMTFDPDTLALAGVFCTTCGASIDGTPFLGGGIWQSGRPPSVDSQGFAYVFTGNGWLHGRSSACPEGNPNGFQNSPAKPVGYLAESLLKLDPGRGLGLVGSWTPWNWCELDFTDDDLGGSGPVLVESRTSRIAVGGGKADVLYTLGVDAVTVPDWVDKRPITDCKGATGEIFVPNPASAGGPLRDCFTVSKVGPPSSIPPCAPDLEHSAHHIMGGPVYWSRDSLAGAALLFVSVESDCIRRFDVPAGRPPVVASVLQTEATIIGHPGAIMSLSANGGEVGSGILWITYASNNSTDLECGSARFTKLGILAAYAAGGRADRAGHLPELWNSDQQSDRRDALGYFAKFNPPTIANGKVYVAAFPPPEWYPPADKCPASAPGAPGAPGSTSPNSVGYLVVYGNNPPRTAAIRSFASELVPTVISPLLL